MVEHPTHALKAMHLQTACTVRMMTTVGKLPKRSLSLRETTQTCGQDATGCEVVVTLTKLGVGEEDDRVIATVTTYADTA